jgi:ureidoglycolate lyase
MKAVPLRPLTREAFAPFGDVIEAEGAQHFAINGGMAERYHDLARVELAGEKARPMISLARGEPYALPLTLTFVERHPLGSQAFFPLTPHPFLVVVAPDLGAGAAEPLAFVTRPGQGINIRRNVWHGILTPLEGVSDFVIVDRGGEGSNLEEYHYPAPFLIAAAAASRLAS